MIQYLPPSDRTVSLGRAGVDGSAGVSPARASTASHPLTPSFENLDSLANGRRRRHAFCALRGKKRAGASVSIHLTQGSAPYRSLHPGLVYVAAFGAWRMFGPWDAGLIGQRRRAPGRLVSSPPSGLGGCLAFGALALYVDYTTPRCALRRCVIAPWRLKKKPSRWGPTPFPSFGASIFMVVGNSCVKVSPRGRYSWIALGHRQWFTDSRQRRRDRMAVGVVLFCGLKFRSSCMEPLTGRGGWD